MSSKEKSFCSTGPRDPAPYFGHVGQPLQQRVDALEVVANGVVGHAIVVHDLNPAQLVVGGVHFPAQHLQENQSEDGNITSCLSSLQIYSATPLGRP